MEIPTKKCQTCGIEIIKGSFVSKKEWKKKGFCSRKCCAVARSEWMMGNTQGFKKGDKPWNTDMKGVHLSPETEFKKGHEPWHKGKKFPHVTGEKNNKWKGDDAGYWAMHDWIRRHYGAPTKCEHCGATSEDRMIQWANKEHKYKRNRSDWMQLCCSCHQKYDRQMRVSKVNLNLTSKSLVLRFSKIY